MTDAADTAYRARLKKRYSAEHRFRFYGAAALVLTSLFLAYLLVDIVKKGWPAFFEHHVQLSVSVDPGKIDPANPAAGDFAGMVKEAWRARFPEVTSRGDRKALAALLSQNVADVLQAKVTADPALIGKTVEVDALLSDEADLYFKGLSAPADATLLDKVKAEAGVSRHFAWRFFANGDSREPELAGLRGAIIGSLLTVAIALFLGLPLGIAAAIYLEE